MNRPWYLSDQRIYDLVWQTGDDALIFGLDFPYNQEKLVQDAIDHVRGLELSDSSKQKILGGNLKRVLGLGPNPA